MSVLRVMGTETEYGIAVPGQPGANAMVTSSQIVNAYQAATAARARRARWDFEEENPLRDARGFDLAREAADSTQLTDEDLGLANVILTNGARLYVDHAHPEYSAPECTNPLSVVIWDKAGERIMAEAAAKAATVPGSHGIQLYKNNTDNKGASYGCHENYLMRRSTPFADIVRYLTPFFVTRQVVCGAGRVGIGADGRGTGFQISQRADFFEVEVGLETTLKRPIINTRDEPHADPEKYRRLHVIIGDANMSEVATYLKMGTTALVLAMIEDKFLNRDLSLETPVADLRAVSHDPSLKHLVTLRDGRKMTAVQLQTEYLEIARKYVEDRYGADADDDDPRRARPLGVGARAAGRRPHAAVARAGLGGQARAPGGLPPPGRSRLGSPEAAAVRPAVLRRTAGPRAVQPAGRARPYGPADYEDKIAWAIDNPPEDTRAYFRGRCLRQYAGLGGRRVLGLGDLRHTGPGVAAASPDARAAARHPRARRRAARPLPHRRRPRRRAHGAGIATWYQCRAGGLGGTCPGDYNVGAVGGQPPRNHGGTSMASAKDTGGQRQTTRRAEETEEDQAASADEVKERHEKLSDDVDAILDEIDEVLEENAEEFVRSYVQKGGQ